MYFHIIISGGMIQEKRERVFIKERDKEAKKGERVREITILNLQRLKPKRETQSSSQSQSRSSIYE